MKPKVNLDLTLLGVETLLLVGYYVTSPHPLFKDDLHSHLAHLTFLLLPSTMLTLALLGVGIFGVAVGLYLRMRGLDEVATVALGTVWAVNVTSFIIQDIHFGGHVQLGTLLSIYVMVRILCLARFGGRFV